jgi:hypothetical protein
MSRFQFFRNLSHQNSRRQPYTQHFARLVLSTTLIIGWVGGLSGCGRGTTVYSEPSASSPSSNPPVTVIDGKNILPDGFYDQSVNDALVDLGLDGSTPTAVAIRLQTKPTLNDVGGFNGAGTGNLALLGISLYSGTPLSALSALSFDGLVDVGIDQLGAILQVDLLCDGTTTPRVFTTNAAALATGAVSASYGYSTFNAGLDQNIWQVVGAPITDPKNVSTILVPSSGGSSTNALQDLITSYPQACIFNGISSSPALPNGIPIAGILFSLGSQNEFDQNTAFINHFRIASDSYDSSLWGTNQ